MTITPETEARRIVDLRRLQLCATALDYADEPTAFALMVAASRYATAVHTLRQIQRREEPPCTPLH